MNYSVLEKTLRHAQEWLAGLDKRPVGATESLETLRRKITSDLGSQGTDPSTVIEELVEATKHGHLGCASGRFFAWVIGGALPSALAADWLTSTWDQNAVLYSCAPAASVLEEIAGCWILEILDLPRESSFAFTTGCQMAHFTALSAARAAVLEDAGWDVYRDGLFGAPRIQVLASEQRHGSIDRALRHLGFGSKSVSTEDPREALKTESPKILILSAADINTGSFDAFEELIPLAKSARAWVHVDGAFGLFARVSRSKRHLTAGIEKADSWATDAHKWLNVPFDSGIAIIKDRTSHREAMTIGASYIEAESQARDQIDWTPEWSRRARGISVYAALRELGKNGVEELVDRSCRHCHTLVTEIAKFPGVEMLWEPKLNQGLVRFLDPQGDHDRRTVEVIAKINASGEAFFSSTSWKGKKAMRVSVVNWRTDDPDIKRTLAAVRTAIVQ